jgi:hypothetical protein
MVSRVTKAFLVLLLVSFPISAAQRSLKADVPDDAPVCRAPEANQPEQQSVRQPEPRQPDEVAVAAPSRRPSRTMQISVSDRPAPDDQFATDDGTCAMQGGVTVCFQETNYYGSGYVEVTAWCECYL